jgi:hypothetical protein
MNAKDWTKDLSFKGAEDYEDVRKSFFHVYHELCFFIKQLEDVCIRFPEAKGSKELKAFFDKFHKRMPGNLAGCGKTATF